MFGWLKRTVGDRPVWAIFIAALIAAAASALVSSVPRLFDKMYRKIVGGERISFLVRHATTSQPLEGVTISVLSVATLKPVQISSDGKFVVATQQDGLARATVDLVSGDYTIQARYIDNGAVYLRTDPLMPKDRTLFTLDFDPRSWWRIGDVPRERTASQVYTIQELSDGSKLPAWLGIASRELGQSEVSGEENNPRIVQYLSSVGISSGDEVPWNSAFVNWVLLRSGVNGTGSGLARSWLTWGRQSALVPGCVAVFWRGSPSAQIGHVAFFLKENGTQLEVLGGNQHDSVSVTLIDRSRLLDCRLPTEQAE